MTPQEASDDATNYPFSCILGCATPVHTTHYGDFDRGHIEHKVAFWCIRVAPGRVIGDRSMVHLDPGEVLALLKVAKAKSPRCWAMILVTYKHGLRATEICNLRLDDVDLKNGTIVVDRLKGSMRTTQAITGHRGEPLLDELKALRLNVSTDWAPGSSGAAVLDERGNVIGHVSTISPMSESAPRASAVQPM